MNAAERERIRVQVAESRRLQGLPATVEDPGVLGDLAGLLAEAPAREGGEAA